MMYWSGAADCSVYWRLAAAAAAAAELMMICDKASSS